MVFETMTFTNPTINNSCSMEATISFHENGATLNFNQGYLKAPTMKFENGVANLSNGSMLDATTNLAIPAGYAKFMEKVKMLL